MVQAYLVFYLTHLYNGEGGTLVPLSEEKNDDKQGKGASYTFPI